MARRGAVVKTLTSIGLAAGLAISLSTAANATPMLVGTTADPMGINDLVVDGTTYDVTFSTTTLNSFTYLSTLSEDADFYLTQALNMLGVTVFGNANPKIQYLIDIDNSLANWDGPACDNTPSHCAAGDWFEGVASGPWVLGSNALGTNTLKPPILQR